MVEIRDLEITVDDIDHDEDHASIACSLTFEVEAGRLLSSAEADGDEDVKEFDVAQEIAASKDFVHLVQTMLQTLVNFKMESNVEVAPTVQPARPVQTAPATDHPKFIEVYKVVKADANGRYYSVLINDKSTRIEYKKGGMTDRPFNYGPVAVFDTEATAKSFKNGIGYSGSVEIWKCKAKLTDERPEKRDIKADGSLGEKNGSAWPIGTLFANWISFQSVIQS